MRIVRGDPVELPATDPPPTMFAPPGRPDATTAVLESATPTPPGRSGTGDTLLHELLKQDQEPPKAHPPDNQEPL
jgi:hypothetical protein